MMINIFSFQRPSATESQTFKAIFERTCPFSLRIAGSGLVGNTIKSSKFVHYGEPYYNRPCPKGYGLFHYQNPGQVTPEIPSNVRSSSAMESHKLRDLAKSVKSLFRLWCTKWYLKINLPLSLSTKGRYSL